MGPENERSLHTACVKAPGQTDGTQKRGVPRAAGLGMRHKDMCATSKVSVPNLAERNTPNALKRLV